jgi:capsular exopolysaccharide synthesis family protein
MDEDLSPYISKVSKNLFVLPAGSPMPDSAEWLGSPGFEKILDSLSARYDYIIIDSPPITAFADSTVLASMADGVLMVVQGSQSSLETVRHSAKLLRMVGAKIVGVVINKVSTKTENYGRFYAQ